MSSRNRRAPDTADKASTADRILQAAADEFAEYGFAGARVDRIAKRANCNKQLLYHHYGGKEDLCRLVLRTEMTKSAEEIAELAGSVGDGQAPQLLNLISMVFDKYSEDPDHVRLALWERLDFNDEDGEILEKEARRERLHEFIDEVLAPIPAERRPYVAMAVFSLGCMPFMMSQMTQIIADQKPTDDAFRERYFEALRWLLNGTKMSDAEPASNDTSG